MTRKIADARGSTLVLRRAAELLFARKPRSIEHPNGGLRVFRVIGTERQLGAKHNVEELPRFEGNLPSIIQAVFSRIQGLLRRPKRLRGLHFEEAPEYPNRDKAARLAKRKFLPERFLPLLFYASSLTSALSL